MAALAISKPQTRRLPLPTDSWTHISRRRPSSRPRRKPGQWWNASIAPTSLFRNRSSSAVNHLSTPSSTSSSSPSSSPRIPNNAPDIHPSSPQSSLNHRTSIQSAPKTIVKPLCQPQHDIGHTSASEQILYSASNSLTKNLLSISLPEPELMRSLPVTSVSDPQPIPLPLHHPVHHSSKDTHSNFEPVSRSLPQEFDDNNTLQIVCEASHSNAHQAPQTPEPHTLHMLDHNPIVLQSRQENALLHSQQANATQSTPSHSLPQPNTSIQEAHFAPNTFETPSSANVANPSLTTCLDSDLALHSQIGIEEIEQSQTPLGKLASESSAPTAVELDISNQLPSQIPHPNSQNKNLGSSLPRCENRLPLSPPTGTSHTHQFSESQATPPTSECAVAISSMATPRQISDSTYHRRTSKRWERLEFFRQHLSSHTLNQAVYPLPQKESGKFTVRRQADMRYRTERGSYGDVKLGIRESCNGNLLGEMTICPRSSTGLRRTEGCKEWYFVLKGCLDIEVGDISVRLHKGDDVEFEQETVFQFRNPFYRQVDLLCFLYRT